MHITPCLSPLAGFGTRRMGPAAADDLPLPYPCPRDKGSLCWPGVVSSGIHWGCLETDAGEVRSWKRSVSEMTKLNFALKWKQVCQEKHICPGSAFGSLASDGQCRQTGTLRLGWARGQGQGQCSCPRKPCTQIGGLAPLPAVGDGCRGGDALFLPSYALLLSAPVALGLKPPCGDERGGQQHRPPSPATGRLLLPSSPSRAGSRAEIGGKLVPKKSLVGRGSDNTMLLDAKRCGFGCGY